MPEQEPNDDPAHAQTVGLPCECVGQFYPRSDRDWYSFEARKGDSYWIEVFAQRLGLPADPVLLVQQVVKRDTGEIVVTDLAPVDDDGRQIPPAICSSLPATIRSISSWPRPTGPTV